MNMEEKRYQDCSLIVKIWRRRFYFLIPYEAIRFFFLNSLHAKSSDDLIDFRSCWSIAIGLAQSRMNWTYSWEEVKERIDARMDKR